MNIDNKLIIGTLATLFASGGITAREITQNDLDQIANTVISIGQRALHTLEPYLREGRKLGEEIIRKNMP